MDRRPHTEHIRLQKDALLLSYQIRDQQTYVVQRNHQQKAIKPFQKKSDFQADFFF